MRKLTLGLAVSVLANVLLAGWLVAQYFSDVYFRLYVDQFSATYSTLLILTAGVGGGSTVGYIFLKRRGPSTRLDVHGPKLPKLTGAFHNTSTPSVSQTKTVPTVPASTQVAKHTAYAVPPISKSSPSTTSTQKPSSGSTWASTARQPPTKQTTPPAPPILGSRPTLSPGGFDSVRTPTPPASSELRRGTPVAPSSPSPSTVIKPDFTESRGPPQLPPRAESFSPGPPQQEPKPSQDMGFSKWQPEPTPAMPRPAPVFSPGKTELETPTRENQGLNRVPIQGTGDIPQRPQAPSENPVPKWSPIDSGAKLGGPGQPGQWVSPVPRQPFNPSSRPGGPGTAVPGQRQPPPGMSPRPGQPGPTRPMFPPSQGQPRPLAMPGMMRTPVPPQNPPSAFRSGLVVTGPQAVSPRNPGPGQMPGPRPQPIPSQGETRGAPPAFPEKPAFAQSAGPKQPPEKESDQAGSTGYSMEGPEAAPSGGTEMDWDTALDTILKTLRKDKVGEKPS